MTAPASIRDLVARFENDHAAFHSLLYNETQVRHEFIDPLFSALGWDINNTLGTPFRSREVIHEDSLKIGAATRAPDYSFRINGVRKFFVEAKRPAVDLQHDATPAYQVRRYAWSANLPISVLTDFEEFSLYDGRVMPFKGDVPTTARFDYIKYTEYDQRWDEIAEILHRDAVLAGSLEQLAQTKKGHKGGTTVDAAFLKSIEAWRLLLAQDIAARNPSISRRELNYAVQMTLDRIIFLRICEDRGIEPYEQLSSLAGGGQVYDQLCRLFRQSDDKYNSGLFHFRHEKNQADLPDDLTTSLGISDEILREIVRSLYYPESPYVFSVVPVEILGQVYEQFLGKVITVAANRSVVVEDKPEVRKAGGVFYTPRYVVEYIVKQTLDPLLERQTPDQATRLLVLDPACGSGSFLLGAYQRLLDWHLEQYTAPGGEKYASRLLVGPAGEPRLSTAERKRILINNIYGVDIDPQAVEVTKLSLLLKVLEGESGHILDTQLRIFHERALPDLGNNIRCGNSLIGTDFYLQQQIAFIDEEARYRINVFDWQSEFPDPMSTGGFDVIIGNPPYIRMQRIGHSEADYLFAHYQTPTSKTDLSLLFIEKSLSIVKPNGRISFICTSQWLATDYGRHLRQKLSGGQLHQIVDFGSLPVFANADVYPAILVLSPNLAPHLELKRINNVNQLNLVGIDSAAVVHIPLSALSDRAWTLGAVDLHGILAGKSLGWAPLSAFGNAYIGALTGLDAAFVVDRETASLLELEEDLLLPYAYRGAEVQQYGRVHPAAMIIYPYREGPGGSPQLMRESELAELYPNIHTHLLGYKTPLSQRMDSRRLYATGDEWFRFLRPGSFRYIRPAKLLVKGIDIRASVGLLGENTAFNGANCPGVILEHAENYSPYYFLAILNSNLISAHLRAVCPAKLGGYTRFNATNISNVPIITISVDHPRSRMLHGSLTGLAQDMTGLHEQLTESRTAHDRTIIQRQTEALARQIDQLVYKLYDLTAEEISVVEAQGRHN